MVTCPRQHDTKGPALCDRAQMPTCTSSHQRAISQCSTLRVIVIAASRHVSQCPGRCRYQLGAIMSVWYLLVWGVAGGAWWKVLGLW